MRTARRLEHIQPFYVMELAKAAEAVARSPECDPARGGEPMIFLNIGEPDFGAAPAVVAAAEACLREGRTAYTAATGLPALREAIAGWYAARFGLAVDPARIVITAGASGALQLACLALFEDGDEVLMPDPSYPCNRHFVAAAGARATLLPTTAEARFQLDAASVAAHWSPATRGVLLASPSNPTGTSIAAAEMAAIVETVRARGGVTIVDEIYLGLSYEDAYAGSALALGEDVISINSFSKYFGMTGWRLGWMVVPPALVPALERLSQNLYICASTLAQHAALACFTPDSLAEFERRRTELHARRDLVVAGQSRDLVDGGLFDHAGRGLFMLGRAGLGLQAGGERHGLELRNLDRVLDQQPAALRAGHGALHENEAALDVGADHFQILLGAVAGAHVAGHLLVLEDSARILALAGRAVRTVRDRDAVGGAQALEAPALHRAGEALALGDALDVDQLAGDEMVGGKLRAHVEQAVFVHAELDDLRLRLHLGLAEMAALRLVEVLGLGRARAELDGGIAVTLLLAAGDNLQIFERQNGDGHVAAVVLEQAGHPHFLRDHAGAHDLAPHTEARGQFRGRVGHPSKYCFDGTRSALN